ncbi:MAG: triose-phosphate isomerase [Deltaproteobacteria bacterium]|nr:triose-phosphate isomerase [Deltaproteobacteria bacterium]
MALPLVVGNWKMHGTPAEAFSLARGIRTGLKRVQGVEVVLAPPFTSLSAVYKALRGRSIGLAGQNVFWQEQGAFTGEISPKMLLESGCGFVIVGHSERRRILGESDQFIGKKTVAALAAGLRPILCVGETLQERRQGSTRKIIGRQLRVALKGITKNAIGKIEIAYEPVWAIGTGRNATPDQISLAHQWIRELLRKLAGNEQAAKSRILYGGSVRPENAGDLARAPEVNGLLVGGASLKAESFLSIVNQFISI